MGKHVLVGAILRESKRRSRTVGYAETGLLLIKTRMIKSAKGPLSR